MWKTSLKFRAAKLMITEATRGAGHTVASTSLQEPEEESHPAESHGASGSLERRDLLSLTPACYLSPASASVRREPGAADLPQNLLVEKLHSLLLWRRKAQGQRCLFIILSEDFEFRMLIVSAEQQMIDRLKHQHTVESRSNGQIDLLLVTAGNLGSILKLQRRPGGSWRATSLSLSLSLIALPEDAVCLGAVSALTFERKQPEEQLKNPRLHPSATRGFLKL
ncbi:hypothetical protein DNTS_018091 [Danionella cerebrum]|uniref:Uncharacterized protein n=1 Tax=Danionella cerebrum TaxID=2873325 RepID=A0A553QGX3_9TELE|nr:hypothetical protein DNTS_018091 [Danionella translucida]